MNSSFFCKVKHHKKNDNGLKKRHDQYVFIHLRTKQLNLTFTELSLTIFLVKNVLNQLRYHAEQIRYNNMSLILRAFKNVSVFFINIKN